MTYIILTGVVGVLLLIPTVYYIIIKSLNYIECIRQSIQTNDVYYTSQKGFPCMVHILNMTDSEIIIYDFENGYKETIMLEEFIAMYKPINNILCDKQFYKNKSCIDMIIKHSTNQKYYNKT